MTLSQADRVDSPTPAGPLSAVLDLTVVDLTAGRTVFAGKLAALHDVALGGFAQGDSHRYRFAVTFPGGGALDNQLQGASTTVSYVWSAGPVAPAPKPTATPPASAPPSTLGTTVPRPAPTARLDRVGAPATGARRPVCGAHDDRPRGRPRVDREPKTRCTERRCV